jgi:hypothetical protein
MDKALTDSGGYFPHMIGATSATDFVSATNFEAGKFDCK